MILAATDLADWVDDRKDHLVSAWAVEIERFLGLDGVFAECVALEWQEAMLACLRGKGTERDFGRMVASAPLQVDPVREASVAERFYLVTLKLARAASRHERYQRTSGTFPFLRAFTAGDDRVPVGQRAIDGIVLPINHPFWRTWCPPLDMDCRASTIQMLRRHLAEHPETSEEELAWREARLTAHWPPAFGPLLDFRR